MAISFVEPRGTIQVVSSTSDLIPTPAGSIGDLVLFILVHDDFSDGNLLPISEPITLTEIIPSQSTQLCGDFRANCYWGIEDQAAARDFQFGTLTGTEEVKGVCLRFAGVVSAAPILAGTPVRQSACQLPSLTATKAGQWFVQMMLGDTLINGANNLAAPSGWTERVDSLATSYSIYVMTKPVTTEELILTSFGPTGTATTGCGYGFGFVLDVDSPTAYTISGVTKDAAGTALGSCTVVLLKDAGTNDWKQVATQTSNATTGAYSFTVYDNDAKYMVIAYKGDTPHVFDVTDYVLQPSA